MASSSSSSKLSADAVAFVPSCTVVKNEDVLQLNSSSTVPAVRSWTQEAVTVLICRPQDFYEIANNLASELSVLIQDDDSLTVLVDELVDQGINVENFQYQNARLCTFLYQTLPEDVAKGFRTGLLSRCKCEFERKSELVKTAVGCNTLVRLTLFLSELMLQMKTDAGETMGMLPTKIIELLECLLSAGSDEAVRGLVHTFKLAGLTLEKQAPKKVEEFISRLKLVTTDEKLSNSQRRMLLSVVEFRASFEETETGDETTPAASLADSAITRATGDGVNNVVGDVTYYSDSDDEELMERYGAEDFDVINDGDVEYIVPRDDMDPEMEDAYEHFMSSK